ncbi:MAG TPA: GNAT family N-acetyltransferase [Candidatus Dormibacteraeota bacterium]|jgi:GNAT superfamily N-acetyltransferase|nr:GNAT family N-acetyltransferase [Candidatus Dormibacteraeota bacterium]
MSAHPDVEISVVGGDGRLLESVAELFDDYRAHYGRERSRVRARAWLGDQISSGRIRMAAAIVEGAPRAFVTTAPSPASLALGTAWMVKDLWVDAAFRRSGLARRLIEGVVDAARLAGATRLSLQTEPANAPALSLYAELGFRPIEDLTLLGLDL